MSRGRTGVISKEYKGEENTEFHDIIKLFKIYRVVNWQMQIKINQVKRRFHTEYGPENIDEILDKLEQHFPQYTRVHRTTYFRWREQAFEAVGSILWGYEGESEQILKQEEVLNRTHLEQLSQNTQRIREKLEKVLSYIPSESQPQFFTLWLWNSALLEDLCQLEEVLTEGADTDTLFSGRAAYVNALYGNPLADFDFSYFPNKKTELFLYAITNRKKSFLTLAQEQEELLLDLPDGSMLFEPDIL